MTRNSRKSTNNKPNKRSIIDINNVQPKWLYYQPQTGKYTVQYTHKAKSKVTKTDSIKKAACLSMFSKSCSTILSLHLDPSIMRRYQRNMRVGCLSPEYFTEYFQSYPNYTFSNKKQYIKYNNNSILVECPTYEFNGFDNLPGLNCGKSFAFMVSRTKLYVPVFHNFLPVYWLEQRSFIHFIYFTRIAFSCNPVNQMISCDFDFAKELIDEQTGQRFAI